MAASAALVVDWPTFAPWTAQRVRHVLVDHPLMQPAALAALGARLQARNLTRSFANSADAATPINDAPRLHPAALPAHAAIESIDGAGTWLSLLNVQADPPYRELVESVLGEAARHIGARDPGMSYRAGWVFVSSARTVTPFHIDKEQNFLLQISGHKTVYVWDHRDTDAVPDTARELFHASHDRSLVRWREELRARASVYRIGPGEGVYIPATSPHLIETHDESSVSMSFSYYTVATRRNAVLHVANHRLRRRGHSPAPLGTSPLRDAAVLRLAQARGFAGDVIRALTARATSRPTDYFGAAGNNY